MGESVKLIFQLFALGILATVIWQFFISTKDTTTSKIVDIACYIGMMYIVLRFVADKLMPEITVIYNLGF